MSALLISVLFTLFLSLYPNFHIVIPSQVYRSAQLNTAEYHYYVQHYHIRSVINLRGENDDAHWYQEELSTAKTLGVVHYDLSLPAKALLDPTTLKKLAFLLKTAPKPVLIHCWRGADRTGFASALAEILLTQTPTTIAEKQISWQYGAISVKTIGRLEFSAYRQWIILHHLPDSTASFQDWINH